jgi:hypothetical protein
MERISAGNVEFHVETSASGADDGGPSIQVRASEDGRDVQLLRFDCFRDRPHYHYAPGPGDTRYYIDPTVVGDSLPWVISQLRTNLGPMLGRAGYPALGDTLDPSAVANALDEVDAYFQATASGRA